MRHARTLALATLATLALAGGARAQLFQSFLLLESSSDGYVEVPHSAALNPGARMTVEMWVSVAPDDGCRVLLGKGFATSYAVGLCNGTLVSSLKGSDSTLYGGAVSELDFHHLAVTYDGAHRRHYVDGELTAVMNETGGLPASTRPLRLGGDAEAPMHSIEGLLLEVRLWNVARTQAEIQHGINHAITGRPAGLVAQWHLAANADESIAGRDGTLHGSARWGVFAHGTASCVADARAACFFDRRFSVTGDWAVYSAPAADGTVHVTSRGVLNRVPGSSDSATNFWFFDPANWELLVKGVDACSYNSRWWIFSAATTNVHYTLGVYDNVAGRLRIYQNFAGPPAPAVTDVDALPCP